MRKFISVLAVALAGLSLALASTAGAKSFTTKGAWSFVSAPGVNPPKLTTDMPTVKGKLARGDFMLANAKNLSLSNPMVGEGGPMIVNAHLQPVWFKPVVLKVSKQGQSEIGANSTFNLHEQTYLGQPVLSWWQGSITNAGDTTNGEDVVVNQHYQTVATLKAPNTPACAGCSPWVITQHEFVIQGQNAWVTAYAHVPMDLRKYGGPQNGTLIDAAVQEYNLKTGQMILNWDALKHIPLSDLHSKPRQNGVWDAYHENSINLGSNGSFLVSMRNEWTGYDVDAATGNILWKISGDPKLSTFKLPSSARFQWQHDIELHPGNVVSVFDDHCCNVSSSGRLVGLSPARGLVLKLNFSKHTATLVHAYSNGKNLLVPFLGNTQLVPGGNVVIGWGNTLVALTSNNTLNAFTEYTSGGTRLLDARIPLPDLSYRTYLQNWVGLPLTTPSGAVRSSHGKTTVYASWNGATKVLAWRVRAGSSKTHLSTVVKSASKTGFETAIPVKGSPKVFEVQALSSSHKVLATSKPFGTSSPALVGGY